MMDIQNRNNLIMSQNQKLKQEVLELEAKLSSRTSLTFEGETSKKPAKDIDHVKDILLKFLRETPITSKNNEHLLLIVFSMLFLDKEQQDEIQRSRKLASAQYQEDILKKKPKAGLFSGLFNKKEKKGK